MINMMTLFGWLMILCMVQLFVFGSMIQRGKETMIPDFCKKGITNMPMYCRMFGNRLLLLGLIAAACAWLSFTALTVNLTPVYVFGAGILLVIVLLVMDHKKYSQGG